jgi:membrane fusion protein, multidrug efflux system
MSFFDQADEESMNFGNKTFLAILLLCVCLLGGCVAASQTRAPETRGTTATGPLVVHVFTVRSAASATESDLLIPAAISVADTAVVLAERDGRILKLPAQEGKRVMKGDLLAQFNDDDQQEQLRQAELEVSRLKVEEQQYEAQVKLSRNELDRELLLASQGLSSKAQVEQAQYKLEQSKHEYEKTRLSTESAQARVALVKLELQKSSVRAPLTGVLTRRYVSEGTDVAKNDKLFEVAQLSRTELRFRLPQTSTEKPKVGELLDLSGVNSDAIIAKALIRRIDPVADPNTNTIGYVADIVSRLDVLMMPGLAVNVHLPRPGSKVSFWIPRAAFVTGPDVQPGSTSTLFVIDGDKASARQVTIAALEGDQVAVSTGLKNNDRVVLVPPVGLKDGDKVEVR